MITLLTEDQMLDILRRALDRADGQLAFLREHGLTIGDDFAGMFSKRRPIPPPVLEVLGYRRVRAYQWIDESARKS